MEHARQFTSKNGKKWVADTHKVVKVLHDMLYQLQLHAGEDSPTNLRRLQVVGMVAAGKCHGRSRFLSRRSLQSTAIVTDYRECRMELQVIAHGLCERLHVSPMWGRCP